MDCLFCKIANKEVPSKPIYEDDLVYAFYDIAPQAPFHAVIIPKQHIQSVSDCNESTEKIVGHIFTVAAIIAKENGLTKDGYRIVTNIGENGGQTVLHMHYHMLGGRSLQWPPG